jgi:hypothetical protein
MYKYTMSHRDWIALQPRGLPKRNPYKKPSGRLKNKYEVLNIGRKPFVIQAYTKGEARAQLKKTLNTRYLPDNLLLRKV